MASVPGYWSQVDAASMAGPAVLPPEVSEDFPGAPDGRPPVYTSAPSAGPTVPRAVYAPAYPGVPSAVVTPVAAPSPAPAPWAVTVASMVDTAARGTQAAVGTIMSAVYTEDQIQLARMQMALKAEQQRFQQTQALYQEQERMQATRNQGYVDMIDAAGRAIRGY